MDVFSGLRECMTCPIQLSCTSCCSAVATPLKTQHGVISATPCQLPWDLSSLVGTQQQKGKTSATVKWSLYAAVAAGEKLSSHDVTTAGNRKQMLNVPSSPSSLKDFPTSDLFG